MTQFANPICLALDMPDLKQALKLANDVKPFIGMLKVGMEFFYAHGAAGYEKVAKLDIPIFLDLKLHDIPNTVANGLNSLLNLAPAPTLLTVHCSGGLDMMLAAKDAVGDRAKVIGVTILTSLTNQNIWDLGFDTRQTPDHALNLARLAIKAGLDGVVCSPLDLIAIRDRVPEKFLTVVPGIRPANSAINDQVRIATPESARAAGADILVIGRPITGAEKPAEAAKVILESLPR